MSVTYYKTRSSDENLKNEICAVCRDEVALKNGKAHGASLNWCQRLVSKRPPILRHAIHSACLEEWIGTRLSGGQSIPCPNCRGSIAIPLKDRIVIELGSVAKYAFIISTFAMLSGLSLPTGLSVKFPLGYLLIAAIMDLAPQMLLPAAVLGTLGAHYGTMQSATIVVILMGTTLTPFAIRAVGIENAINKIRQIVTLVGVFTLEAVVITEAGAVAGGIMTDLMGVETAGIISRAAGTAAGIFAGKCIDKMYYQNHL